MSDLAPVHFCHVCGVSSYVEAMELTPSGWICLMPTGCQGRAKRRMSTMPRHADFTAWDHELSERA